MRRLSPLLALTLLLGCTPDLNAEDAKPFQACAQDEDCVSETFSCGDTCAGDLAVARAEQQAWEQLKGCWPSASFGSLSAVDCSFSNQCPRCASGLCGIAACSTGNE